MVSTVTVSTVTTIAVLGLGAIISGAAIATFLFLLTAKEHAITSSFLRSRINAAFLDIGILPMLIAFVVIIAVDIAQKLS